MKILQVFNNMQNLKTEWSAFLTYNINRVTYNKSTLKIETTNDTYHYVTHDDISEVRGSTYDEIHIYQPIRSEFYHIVMPNLKDPIPKMRF